MKKLTKNILITLGIVLAIGFIAYFGKTFAITGTELGWIPYSSLNSQFTDVQKIGLTISQVCGQQTKGYSFSNNVLTETFANCYCTGGSPIECYGGGMLYQLHNSTLWQVYTTSSVRDNNGNIPQISVTGGDNDININSAGSTQITFKEDLKYKHFKVDYKLTGSPTSGLSVGNGVIEIIPSVIEEKYFTYINGQKVNENNYENSLYLKIDLSPGNNIELTNPRWKPMFDCNVSNDAVLIFDEFSAGSIINITSLNYPLKQWCLNQPVIIRSLTSSGIATDTSNELLLRLSEGGNIVVPSGKTYRIPYITKVQTGLLRCNVNQIFNTKTNACENFLSAPIVDTGGSYVSSISLGENEISYTKKFDSNSPIVIGNKIIQSDAPSYNCPCNTEGRITPDKNPECWSINIGANKIISRTTYKINDYLSLYYETQGAGVFNGITTRNQIERQYNCEYTDESDWINVFKLSIDKNGLKVISVPSLDTSIIPGNKYVINVGVKNDLASFEKSGFKIRTINNIIGKITEEEQIVPLSLGTKNYPVTISTSLAGDTTFEIVPFVEIDGKKIYGSSMASYSYIEKNITETITLIQNCKNVGCKTGQCMDDGNCLIQTTSNCKITGCTQGECLSDGNCLVKLTQTVTKNCKTEGCDDGKCLENGNCLISNATIEKTKIPTSIYFIAGGILLVIMLLLGILFWLRRK